MFDVTINNKFDVIQTTENNITEVDIESDCHFFKKKSQTKN